MTCPVCSDRLLVPILGMPNLQPCPAYRPAAPGRLLKAVPSESLGAEEIARELSDELGDR